MYNVSAGSPVFINLISSDTSNMLFTTTGHYHVTITLTPNVAGANFVFGVCSPYLTNYVTGTEVLNLSHMSSSAAFSSDIAYGTISIELDFVVSG